MAKTIILISGSIFAGKSELSKGLRDEYGAYIYKTSDLVLKVRSQTSRTRDALQKAGNSLDRATGGKWVEDALSRIAQELPDDAIIVVDSVRKKNQIDHVRRVFQNSVYHLHLSASHKELKKRFYARERDIDTGKTFETVAAEATEKSVTKLAKHADVIIHTDSCKPEDVLVRAESNLRLAPMSSGSFVDVVIGGQYGSEGKGNIAAYLAQEYDVLVRVGGPNAGHKVYDKPPQVFHHLPSGSVNAPDAQILIGPGAVINPRTLLDEIDTHQIEYGRLKIHPSVMVIDYFDPYIEQEKLASISSTSQGVGSATARRIMDRGLRDADGNVLFPLAKDVAELRPFIGDVTKEIESAIAQGRRMLLEGTQGTALSLYHGYYPFVTSRDTTVSGCLAEAGIPPSKVRKVIMVVRTYPIRVGGPSGTLPLEIDFETVSNRSGIDISELKKTETTTTTGRERRVGEFDWAQVKNAAFLNGPTDVALTFVDYLDQKNKDARRYDQLTRDTVQFIEELERVLSAPVSLISTRFHYRNIIDRRHWK
jgi:adenylosuccinate synthase